MYRRTVMKGAVSTLAGLALPKAAFAAAKLPELRIARIIVQDAKGRRLTPVARNAYADYRGYDVSETLLRIRTANGIEGIARAATTDAALLGRLIGLDAVDLFAWEGERIAGPAPAYAAFLAKLGGTDVALVDLIARAWKKPAHALLGSPVRDRIPVYDSSLYMEDLLTREQLQGLAYLEGRQLPSDPALLPAIKAKWVVETRPEGFRALKIKLGRSRWMASPQAAVERDIAVTREIRKAVGPDINLMVDANKDYQKAPHLATTYAEAVEGDRLHFLEEMFPETQTEELIAFHQALRRSGNPVKLAYGESHRGGVPEDIYKRRVNGAGGEQPLIDVEQADMNAHGFLYLRNRAATQRPLGMTMAPHNFGSKMGLYAMSHLATIVPNWEISELDDSMFPGIVADGVEIKNGMARCTGSPGLGVSLVADHLSPAKIDLT